VLFELITGEQFNRFEVNNRIKTISDPYFVPILQLCLEPNHHSRIRIWELSTRINDLTEAKNKPMESAPQAPPIVTAPLSISTTLPNVKRPLFVPQPFKKIRDFRKVVKILKSKNNQGRFGTLLAK
jgi:hypothetical protein